MVVIDRARNGPVIFIDRSAVHENRWDELKAGIRALVAFVDSHQPEMATSSIHLDEDAHQMTVVSALGGQSVRRSAASSPDGDLARGC